MKSTKILFTVFMLVLAIAACSGSGKNNEDSENPDNSVSDGDVSDESTLPDEEGNDSENSDDNLENIDGDEELNDAENDGDTQDEFAKSPDFEDLECGTAFGDIACDFTLPLESGKWNFAENYSKNDNYLFVFYRAKISSSRQIWTSELYNLFDRTPKNVTYFFLVDTKDGNDAKEKIQTIRDSIAEAIDFNGDSSVVKQIHLIEKPLSEIDSWINKWLNDNQSEFFFGIDRERRIRQGGSFSSWNSNTLPVEFKNLYKEAELYDYEKKISDFIKETSGSSTVFKGLQNVPFEEEGWTKEIFFDVDFKGLSGTGELYILLEQICDNPKKCEWDRLERLFLCDEKGENCDTETGRWITTYGRSGKWLTDITPLKPLFEKDGKYKFRFTVDGDYYVNNLDFIFVKKEAEQPIKLIPLFNQREQFDENYNSHFEPQILNEENVKKAEIYAFITGHGNGSEEANCAEFCRFESVFTVNGNDFEIDFNKAGTRAGCFDAVIDGVVPNQYGSWPFGRAGWCPGQDVKLIKFDVTDALVSGENTFSYAGYLDGEVYTPVVTDENGYRAEVYLSSYLVIY